MSDLIRDAPTGQIIRWLMGNKLLLYPEQKPGFQCPSSYTHGHTSKSGSDSGLSVPPSSSPPGEIPLTEDPVPLETASIRRMSLQRSQTRGGDLEKIKSRKDLEQAFSDAGLRKGPTLPVVPQKLENGTILVDWYDTDDPENPQNWSSGKKAYVAFLICAYTFTVYMGSAIYSPSQGGVMERFGVGPTVAALGLALYVLAYGIGPLIFSPMSEIPTIGRNPPYVATFAIFVILCVPTALVDNLPGLLVLRFLQGFFGSPCLATGGASMGDMYSLLKLPYLFVIWAIAATCAPALGPIISGFSVSAKDWHWSLWEILWSAGPVFILMFLTLPETSSANILLRRAHRLRVMTGNKHLRSQSEIDQANLDPTQLAVESFLIPTKIIFLDPAVAFADLYTMLVYGIFYSFFECFPLVYVDLYHFNLGESGLIFLTVTIGVSIAAAGYAFYVHRVAEPDIVVNGLGAPEKRLIPALYAAFLPPIGLFWFAWTARASIHWVVPSTGIVINMMGIFVILQCVFLYVPLVYPKYAASMLAGNDFVRSSFAFAAVLFARPMFHTLGVDGGVSLLAGLTCLCVGGIWALYYQGAKLRARSRFAAK